MKLNLVKGPRISAFYKVKLLNEPSHPRREQWGEAASVTQHTHRQDSSGRWTGWKVSKPSTHPCADGVKWTLYEAHCYCRIGCPWLGSAPVILCLGYDPRTKTQRHDSIHNFNVSILGIKQLTIFYACWDWLSKLGFSRSHGSGEVYRIQRDQEKIQWLNKNTSIKQISKITQNFFYFWVSITAQTCIQAY